MKPRVYIETSVVSYYTGRASRDVVIAGHQQSTQDFWPLLSNSLLPHVSALVLKEAGRGDSEKMMIRQAVENAGYECPEIVSPDAFLGDES